MAEWDVSYKKTTRKESSHSGGSGGSNGPPVHIGCGLFLFAVGLVTLISLVM